MNPNKAVFVMALIAIGCVAAVFYEDHQKRKAERWFTQQCAGNKGIAVRDLDEKMRCVPTFSARTRS